jgi:hypothetical protein
VQTSVSCPYCGEPNDIFVDESAGDDQAYIEDCQVCCKPWQVIVSAGPDGEITVDVHPAG